MATVQMWNSRFDGKNIEVRDDWDEMQVALLDLVADCDVSVRFASPGSDPAVAGSTLRGGSGSAVLDPLAAATFVVVVHLDEAAVEQLHAALVEFVDWAELDALWCAVSDSGFVIRRDR